MVHCLNNVCEDLICCIGSNLYANIAMRYGYWSWCNGLQKQNKSGELRDSLKSSKGAVTIRVHCDEEIITVDGVIGMMPGTSGCSVYTIL